MTIAYFREQMELTQKELAGKLSITIYYIVLFVLLDAHLRPKKRRLHKKHLHPKSLNSYFRRCGSADLMDLSSVNTEEMWDKKRKIPREED